MIDKKTLNNMVIIEPTLFRNIGFFAQCFTFV